MAAVLPAVADAIAVASELASSLESISGIIASATAQKRMSLTPSEWSGILAQANRAQTRAKQILSNKG